MVAISAVSLGFRSHNHDQGDSFLMVLNVEEPPRGCTHGVEMGKGRFSEGSTVDFQRLRGASSKASKMNWNYGCLLSEMKIRDAHYGSSVL